MGQREAFLQPLEPIQWTVQANHSTFNMEPNVHIMYPGYPAHINCWLAISVTNLPVD